MDLAREFNFQIFDQLLQQFVALAPKILTGLMVFFAFWVASVMFRSIVLKLHWPVPGDILKLAGHAGEITLIVLGVLTGLGTMGINITALVAGLGLTGFGCLQGYSGEPPCWHPLTYLPPISP